jgi:hypothetical protein
VPSEGVTVAIAGTASDYTITGTHADVTGSYKYDAATGKYTATGKF